MTIFTWKPSLAATANSAPKVTEAKFGDGYVQRSPKGINNNPMSWDLSFDALSSHDADAIEDFLATLYACLPFTWTDLRGRTGQYICPSWSRVYSDEDANSVRAKFEQFFG